MTPAEIKVGLKLGRHFRRRTVTAVERDQFARERDRVRTWRSERAERALMAPREDDR